MTRRGSLAYYLAAWVIGTFIVAIPIGFGHTTKISELLMTYFFALMFGATDALLFALVLRRIMRWIGTHTMWAWLLTGGCMASVLTLLLAWSGNTAMRLEGLPGPLQRILQSVFTVIWTAPITLQHESPWWLVPIDGAVTAGVLCLVDRAFNPPAEAADAKQSPA
jgi:uncharacterized membrane protein